MILHQPFNSSDLRSECETIGVFTCELHSHVQQIGELETLTYEKHKNRKGI